MATTPIAIIGSGNIGTDLLLKIHRHSSTLRAAIMVGIDPQSEGLALANSLGVKTTHEGIDGLVQLDEFNEVPIVFDATSAAAHQRHHEIVTSLGKTILDLTPAAIGPFVVPPVNLAEHLEAGHQNFNMVTCGGQATIPVVAAVSQVAPVAYAEIVASISSRSAGPGTRANIDEFTQTTARGIEKVGGATVGKAIIVLNPADPPILMRNTVFCFVKGDQDATAISNSVQKMVDRVAEYVPGYRLKQNVLVDRVDGIAVPGEVQKSDGLKVTVYLEIEGAGEFLPKYAGNLDIMTSAARATAEKMVSLVNPSGSAS